MSALPRRAKHLIAIGGGKGGVGKSVVAIALACEWARRGRSVVLVDLDLGAANLHTYLGVHGQSPTLAAFLRREVDTLDSLLRDTGTPNLRLLRGADDVPGMANPPHWMKLKVLRHLQAIAADVVVLDLGAGTAFNTLDFFAAAEQGLVVTEPQPAAVMNAYGFIKSALHRRLQDIFRHHPALRDAVERDLAAGPDTRQFSVAWLRETARELAPDAEAAIDEVTRTFAPGIVVNRVRDGDDDALIGNLLSLGRDRLGLGLERVGQLSADETLRRFQLDVPGFVRSDGAAAFRQAAAGVVRTLESRWLAEAAATLSLSEHAQADLTAMIDQLAADQLQGRSRDAWKLRVFFRPQEVVSLLESNGYPCRDLAEA